MPIEPLLPEVDAIFARAIAPGRIPGVAWGVIADGALVHHGGLGTLRVGETATPTVDSVFRIASMTKSFTAASVLLLRDEGRLRLDDPVASHVPDLSGLRGPTADSPPITIRDLLTMSAGFPTDDPWGDRQQGLDLERFGELLRGGLSFAWTPGLRFEYSNLGYGILGRVISNVARVEYREFVRERLLGPLGMASTTFLAEEAAPERLASGYVHRDGVFLPEPIDGYGALAAMGGIFTSVRDLATWVSGFLDAFPPRDDPEGQHPLSRATRREMQQVQRAYLPRVEPGPPDAGPTVAAGGYGYGLEARHDPSVGVIIAHGGGYPGFGSHMRWHPASGIGIVALGNARYAPVSLAARAALEVLVRGGGAPTRLRRPATPAEAARRALEQLLGSWDDDLANRTFAMNVDLDEPLERRRSQLRDLAARRGPFARDASTPDAGDSPFQLTWWVTGRGARVRLELLLSPERPPRVQRFTVTEVPDPSPALRDAAGAIARSLDRLGGAIPRSVALGPTVDRRALRRSLAAAAARFGPVRPGPAIAGDGERSGTFRLTGARGELELAITLDSAAGRIEAISLQAPAIELPAHAD
jgi:CubicO group peptidase (beta-lactamase class C family)